MRVLRRGDALFPTDNLHKFFADKRVLVTGAAGSIGSQLCAQLAEIKCASLAMLDHLDHGLLEIVERVERLNPKLDVVEVLCDVRDRERLQIWMNRVKPDVVIHAAALKHVHMGERHPAECVLTNLVGARNALVAAEAAGAAHFMLVSSDKAASPVCVMGATKRLAELHLAGFQMERASQIKLKSVRFGNVIGSQGSVTPRFSAQINAGGPLEITHPDMQRFFMSANEAVGLILSVTSIEGESESQRAGAYYMDMGEPVSIVELGRDMIERSGKEIDIKFIGLRPGEKLSEELFDTYESVSETSLKDVYRVTPSSMDAYVTSADVARLEMMARTMDEDVLRQRVFAYLDARLGRFEPAAG